MADNLTYKLLTGSQSLSNKRTEIFSVIKILLGLLKQRARIGNVGGELYCGESNYFWKVFNNDNTPDQKIRVEISFCNNTSEDTETILFVFSGQTDEPSIKIYNITIVHKYLDTLIRLVDERYPKLLKPIWDEVN